MTSTLDEAKAAFKRRYCEVKRLRLLRRQQVRARIAKAPGLLTDERVEGRNEVRQ
jgi:hypothetical protein